MADETETSRRIEKRAEYLRYDFSDVEITDFAKSLARHNQELAGIEQRKKTITKDLASQIEDKQSEIQRYSRYINNGHEYRDIECEVRFDDPSQGLASVYRMDTGELVKERKMTSDELQDSFRFDEQKKADDAPTGEKE